MKDIKKNHMIFASKSFIKNGNEIRLISYGYDHGNHRCWLVALIATSVELLNSKRREGEILHQRVNFSCFNDFPDCFFENAQIFMTMTVNTKTKTY